MRPHTDTADFSFDLYDGLTYTLKLRRDVRFSDGTPFTSADVVFTAGVLYDTRVNSPLATVMRVDGMPLAFAAPDEFTVTVTLPSPFAPGLRLLDNLPILPRHRLQASLELPESLRNVLVLRLLRGLPHAEIGRMLGLTANACEVRLCRAIKQLRVLVRETA